MLRWIATLVVAVAICGTTARAAEKLKDGREVDVPKSKLPDKINKAAIEAVPGGKVADIDRDIKDGKSTWQLGVEAGGKEYEVIVNDDGKVLSKAEIQTEKLKVADVPGAVSEGVKKEFPGAKITAATKLTKGGAVSYEMDVDVKKKTYEVVFSPDGQLVSKAEVSEEDEKEKK